MRNMRNGQSEHEDEENDKLDVDSELGEISKAP